MLSVENIADLQSSYILFFLFLRSFIVYCFVLLADWIGNGFEGEP